jgi:hypothetical protein
VKVRGRFTSVPKASTGAAKDLRRVQIPPARISSLPRNLARETNQHDGGEEQQRRRRDAAGGRAETSGAGAAATPATAPRGSVDIALPLRIPFRAEKQGKATKVPGRADGTRGKGKGVVNAARAASALSSTQDNTVRVADAMRRLAVQGTVQPVGGKGIAQHWTAGLAVVVSGGFGMPDVHGRPNVRDIKAAGNCDHAHVRVVTASGVHFSRAQTIDVLEQVLLAVRQDAVDRPSPPDAGDRCRSRVLTEKPKVKRVYPSTSAVHESDEKRKRRRSATLAAASKGVASAADGLQP